VVEAVELLSEDLERITSDVVLTRGLGRSYGDASLPPAGNGPVAGSRLADRQLSFDEASGVLRAEAGFTLRELQRRMLPRGWSSPVCPGTSQVTLGGMVAADVHGKNHQLAGSVGRHVRALRMRLADGRVERVSDESHPRLFRATLGGMGLTGHILEVELQLERVPSAWIWQEVESLDSLESLVERLYVASGSWPFTVAWADTLASGKTMGRGLLIKGRWANPAEAPADGPAELSGLEVPFVAPAWLLRPGTVRLANSAYRWRNRRTRAGIVHPARFFHPLDGIQDWNRLYGRRGFTQYQCVLPEGGPGCRPLLDVLHRAGARSFLTVIKDFGERGPGTLSFPRPGLTVALDIPLEDGRTQRAVDALNDHVAARGGSIYLAKDALSRAEHFRAMEPTFKEFARVRERHDPAGRLRSALSERLMNGAP
jgi:FAD/FMN-containing dehydrogenase